jgi:HD-GYP domain-containing protein (c-di-GMP phosphodiesterase class II)
MAAEETRVELLDLISPLAKTVDMMNSALARHHAQVACLASRLAEELKLSPQEKGDLVVAGALHDIGAFSLDERLDILNFEETAPDLHARAGYLLLKDFAPLANVASIVRFHHVPWNNGEGATHDGDPVPQASHILHLADRVAVLVKPDEAVLGNVPDICQAIEQGKGEVFVPEIVDAMVRLAKKDYVWMDVAYNTVETILRRTAGYRTCTLSPEELAEFAKLICRVIDFKSEFTATHSSGVAAVASSLASKVGFSPEDCKQFETAAHLHDLGKLAIPSEILEKRDALTPNERYVMRTHVYHTHRILEQIEALQTIASWASLHQERLDGSGYPFTYGEDEIPPGARLMAVADVFTALTEDRPYREGMDREQAVGVLNTMATGHELDARLVEVLIKNFDEIDKARTSAQEEASSGFAEFQAALN